MSIQIMEGEGGGSDSDISTGLITGGEVTVNGGDNSKFDIAAGTGVLVDNFTDPLNPTRIKVSWPAFIAETVPNILTQPVTVIGLDLSTGSAVIVFNSIFQFTSAELRVIISLGILGHVDNVTINSFFPQYSSVFDIQKNLAELARFVMIINVSGNAFSPNGANLLLDKSAGKTFSLGVNYANDKQDPNNFIDPVLAGLTFIYLKRDGVGGFDLLPPGTSIDPDQYDDGSGTLAGVAGNRWTIQRIWFFTVANSTLIHYGQALYSTFDDAVAAINTEPFDFAPALTDGFRCWLILKGTTTDLAAAVAAGEAQFILSGRFGDVLRPVA